MLISTLASNIQPVGSNTAIKLAEKIEKNSCWMRGAVIVFVWKHHFEVIVQFETLIWKK